MQKDVAAISDYLVTKEQKQQQDDTPLPDEDYRSDEEKVLANIQSQVTRIEQNLDADVERNRLEKAGLNYDAVIDEAKKRLRPYQDLSEDAFAQVSDVVWKETVEEKLPKQEAATDDGLSGLVG